MVKKLCLRVLILMTIFVLIFPAVSCGGGLSKGTDKLPGQLVGNISQAKTDAERQGAIKDVLCHGLSLGLIDEKGDQLNRNIAQSGVSLTTNDLAAINYFISEGQGYTLDDIVDFLAGTGILLSSSKREITTKDVLPDIQKYVDWSYAHRDDPRSLLGLTLASGPQMQVAGAPPKFQGDTKISNVASLMMLADILVGVPKEKKVSSNLFGKVAYAAESDIQEITQTISGLITIVEEGVKLRDSVAEIQAKLKGTKYEAITLKVPDVLKILVEAFATGSRFAVRLVDSAGPSGNVIKSEELSSNSQENRQMAAVLAVVPSGKVIPGLPVTYTLNLLGPECKYTFDKGYVGQELPLYPDADAVLEADPVGSSIQFNGHRLGIMSKDGTGRFAVRTKNLSNKERRVALLHASAQIHPPEFETLVKNHADNFNLALGITGLSIEKVMAIYSTMQKSLKVTPWVCQVIIPPPGEELIIEPEGLVGEVGKEYTFKVIGGVLPPDCGYVWTLVKLFIDPLRPDISFQGTSDTKSYIFMEQGDYSLSVEIWTRSGQRISRGKRISVSIIPKQTPSILLDIELPPLLETNYSINFKVKPNVPLEQIPQNTQWVWDFNDGTKPYIQARTSFQGQHNYSKMGFYNIKVSLVDKTTNQELGIATKKVEIDDTESINKTNHIQMVLRLYGIMEGNGPGLGPTLQSFSNEFHSQPPWTFEWVKGTNSFKGTFRQVSSTTRGVQTNIHEVQGWIASTPEGIVISQYVYKNDFSNPNYEGSGKEWKYSYRLELRDIRLTKTSGGETPRYHFRVQGKDLAKYVYDSVRQENLSNGQYTVFSKAIWDSIPTDKLPELEIVLDRLKY